MATSEITPFDIVVLGGMAFLGFIVIPLLYVTRSSRSVPLSVRVACYLEQAFGISLFILSFRAVWIGSSEARQLVYYFVGGLVAGMFWITAGSMLRQGVVWAWRCMILCSIGRMFVLFPYGVIFSAISLWLMLLPKSRMFFSGRLRYP